MWNGHVACCRLASASSGPGGTGTHPGRLPGRGSFDTIARVLADKLKVELNRPVVVENRAGAGGRIAVDVLKSSPADGSTVMLGPDALRSLYPYTFRKLNYDPVRDLVPVPRE